MGHFMRVEQELQYNSAQPKHLFSSVGDVWFGQ